MIKLLIEQGSEAWHQARLGRVTGTRFKDLMAAKTTAAYNNLVADIAAELLTEYDEEESGYENEWMIRGKELEPEARKLYEELFECEVEQVGFVTPDEGNTFHEWIGVSPDGIVGDGITEFKCPKRSTHIGYIESGGLPSEYRWQVMGQLYVTGAKWCDFMSYYPGLKPFIIRVYPDPALFAQIEKELALLIVKVKEKIEKYNNYEPIN